MKVNLVCKDVQPTDELVERIESKMDKIEKQVRSSVQIHLTLGKAPKGFTCTTQFDLRGHRYVAHGEGPDLFVAVDGALHRLGRQVTRDRKRRVRRPGESSIRAAE